MINVSPDGSGNLVWSELALDDDDDTIAVQDVYLAEIDGVPTTIAQRYPGWLRSTPAQITLPDGRRQLTLTFSVPAAQVEIGKTYTIAVKVSDGVNDPVFGTFDFITVQGT